MKNLIHNFIYFVIPCFVLFICFSIFSVKSNAEALPVYGLDSSSFQVLQGGSNQAINYYGMNDPSSYLLFGIGQQIYNDVDNYLYTNYGYDFEDMGWAMEDSWKDGSVASALADNFAYNIGGFQSMGEAISNGFVVASTYGKSLLTGAKQYIMGKLSGNTITDVKDNIYTKVTDSYIDKLNSAAVSLKQNDTIKDLSDLDIYYSNSLQTSWTDNNTSYTAIINTNIPVYWCVDGSGVSSTFQYVFGCFPYDLKDSINGTMILIREGTIVSTNSLSFGNWRQDTFNTNSGVTYLKRAFGTSSNQPCSSFLPSYYDSVRGFIQQIVEIGSSYKVSNSTLLETLLNSLKDSWVTSDDLRRIEEKINDLTLGNIVIDGDSTPVIDTDADSLSDLQSLIQSLIDKNADLTNYLNSLEDSTSNPDPGPDPEPEPDTYENTGTKVPDNLPGIFAPLIETIQVPFSIVSMFEPIFYVFTGGLSSLFSIWLLFPLFILVLLVIWALK